MTTLFTQEHEWIKLDGDIATVGITDHAQSQLGDVVFVELPAIGKKVSKGGDAAVKGDHAEPRDGGARIDPEHQRWAHASAIVSSSISKFASTFWTSSSSSRASSNFMS